MSRAGRNGTSRFRWLLLGVMAIAMLAACAGDASSDEVLSLDDSLGDDRVFAPEPTVDPGELRVPTVLPTLVAGPQLPGDPGSVTEPVSADFDTQKLADACWAGLMRECDRLAEVADAASPASTYGATCGLRVDPQGLLCSDLFLSPNVALGRVLADGVNLRTEPDLGAAPVGKLVDSTGGTIPILSGPNEGWYEVVHQFQRVWAFGSFISPQVADQFVVRSTDRNSIEVTGDDGAPIDAGTGSFGLVLGSEPGPALDATGVRAWRVLLPNGDTALVDPSTVQVVAEGAP